MEIGLEEKIRRANEAQALLNNPLLKEAFDGVRESLQRQREEVKLRDTEMHTLLILAEQNLSNLERYLRGVIETGKMADFTLRQQQKAWHDRAIGAVRDRFSRY